MEVSELKNILNAYNLDASEFKCDMHGDGLINKTFLLQHTQSEEKYILQKINTVIFFEPQIIANNVRNAAQYLKKNFPEYCFINFIQTKDGEDFFITYDNEFWRLMPFVQNSFSYNTITNVKQAYDTAKKFGEFTARLYGARVDQFESSIANFHNLELRYQQFTEACGNITSERYLHAKPIIDFLIYNSTIVVTYKNIVSENILPQCIIHADTKINNMLFDKTTLQPVCIIDYDTIMPGYYISDLGDMIRTMVCTADENEIDKNKIVLRKDYYDAVIDGYLQSMQNIMTEAEIKYIHYAGIFMTYMQALRFITDYLNNDKYYSIKYAEHNFDRAQNQCTLLQKLIELNSIRFFV